MSSIPVTVKHGGTNHALSLDTTQPPLAFKGTISDVTGVPIDRMKVMFRGKIVNDDASWDQFKPKAGQTFMVLGSATELPKAPPKPVVFLEDMNDTELADALRMPVGLQNLGNTCYMNATLQMLRGVPELQVALSSYRGVADLPSALRDLYSGMSRTSESFPPLVFLQILRSINPQFAEQSRSGAGYAQQDADELWQQVVTSLNTLPGIKPPSSGDVSMDGSSASNAARDRFVEQFFTGVMSQTLSCADAPDEPPTYSQERILKLDCNISINTNFMMSGIKDSLDQQITKQSPSLGREAVYTQKSRISRLPEYLTVHMVRFYWRRDIGKKAKIMRKVKFPFEFDATELSTPELEKRLKPVQIRMRELDKERDERRKVRRKTKDVTGNLKKEEEQKEMEQRAKEAKELEALVDPDLKADLGASLTGMYDLIALVTHKGASADSGHYIGWVRKDAISKSTAGLDAEEADKELWYKFDDANVSTVDQAKISALDGGGEDSTAYILLYRSKRLE